MISLLLWAGLSFLIKVIITLFFAFVGGLGLAAGFDFYKKFKTSWSKKKNQSYVDNLQEEVLAGATQGE